MACFIVPRGFLHYFFERGFHQPPRVEELRLGSRNPIHCRLVVAASSSRTGIVSAKAGLPAKTQISRIQFDGDNLPSSESPGTLTARLNGRSSRG